MSHEIRTPVNGVIGMATLLAQTDLDERQRMLSDVVLRSGEQLLTVINDILDFSRVEAGRMTLNPAPFRLSRLLEEPARLVSRAAEQKRLELMVRIQPDLPAWVEGDFDRLRQVVTNLVANAVKFTAAGHVLLEATGAVEGQGPAARLVLRIAVHDTGPGVPPDQRARIFEKFTQVDGSSTRAHEGTGLGLSIARGLIELMGGTIGLDSTLGRGSIFRIDVALPLAATPADEAPGAAPPRRVDGAAVASGREALQLLRGAVAQGRPFDLVILDHHMPGMDGMQTLAAIRRDPAIAAIPALLLTSLEAPEDGATTPDGPDARLSKPAARSALFDRIVEALAVGARRAGAAAAATPTGIAPDPAPPSAEPPASRPAAGSEVQPPAAAAAATDRGPPTSEAVVLVVDDNPINRLLLQQALRDAPVRIVEAENGVQAIELCMGVRPQLVLMDVSMPVMDGYEATRRIRLREAAARLPPTPVVGVTAHALPTDRARCLEAGMDEFLPKPIELARLEAIVARWLPRRAA